MILKKWQKRQRKTRCGYILEPEIFSVFYRRDRRYTDIFRRDEKGITCVETFDFDVVDKIYRPYDNLVLAVTLKADGSTDKKVLGSLAEAIKAQSEVPEEWDRLKEIFSDKNLQMISFTITEKGYALKGVDGNYFPFIQKDIDNGPEKPVSAMAVVCALLYERFQAGKAPLAVVSMDNCSHNGEKLRNSILTMAKEWEKKDM